MAIRQAGLLGDQTDAAATAFPQLELNPATPVQVTEFGISLNAAPNSTDVPSEWVIQRMSAGGTGGAALTPQPLQEQLATITTTGKTHVGTPFTVDGTVQDELHRFYVPNVTGMIWVAAPGREFDCIAANFLQMDIPLPLATGVRANIYMVFEE